MKIRDPILIYPSTEASVLCCSKALLLKQHEKPMYFSSKSMILEHHFFELTNRTKASKSISAALFNREAVMLFDCISKDRGHGSLRSIL